MTQTLWTQRSRFGFTPRLVLFSGAMVALSMVISSLLVYRANKRALEQSLGRELLAVVNALAPQLDADLHELVHKGEGRAIAGEEEFEHLRAVLVKAKQALNLESPGSPLYTMRPTAHYADKGELEFVVMTDRDSTGQYFVGNLYQAQPHNRSALAGEPAASGVYGDSEGFWISASAPIRASDGRVVALLQADRPVNFFYEEAREQAVAVFRGALASFVMALGVAVLLARTFTRPIRELARATRALGRGDFRSRVEIRRSDEIGELASRFNDMANSLEAAHEHDLKQREELFEAQTGLEQANAQLNQANAELNAANDKLSRMNAELNRANGQLERMVVASNRLAEDAQAANQAKGEFLATMSHELRTPMNAVVGFADLLGESELNQEQKDYVEMIRGNAARLLQMISQLLTYSNLDSIHDEDIQEPVDLPGLLVQLQRGVALELESKQLECRLEVPDPFPGLFHVDRALMQHAVGNLFHNAVKFTEKGWVSVRVGLQATKEFRRDMELWDLRLEVSDTGVGVPPEKVGRLFRMFSQADGSATRLHGGMGMGLALAHKIVERWNGQLSYEPRLEGGSTFTIRVRLPLVPDPSSTAFLRPSTRHSLPVVSPEKVVAVPASSDHVAPAQVVPMEDLVLHPGGATGAGSLDTELRLKTGTHIRVLVVGDDMNQGGSLTETLLRLGHHPDAAPASRFAVLLARKRKFDLILMRFEAGDPVPERLLRQIRAVRAGEDRGASHQAVAVAFHRMPPAPSPSDVEIAGFAHVISNVYDEEEIRFIMGLLKRRQAA